MEDFLHFNVENGEVYIRNVIAQVKEILARIIRQGEECIMAVKVAMHMV